jgi:tonB-linked outer membrane protein, susC/ragA family
MNFISILKGRKQQFLPKNLLIIKICSLLLVCCNVMAFGADNHTRDPLVSVNMKNATLESVLNYIEETTSYSFLYNKQQVDVGQRIDISQKDQPISVILDILFKGSDITYSINGKQIVLSKSRSNASSKVDKRLLTGTVIDSKGEAVIGANVIVKGEKSGKATDIEGNFSIEVPDKGVLLVSYIGFQPQEVSYGTKKNVTVVLQENNTSLDEVVVVGFGKQKKESVIGAIQSVKASELRVPTTNLTNTFAGRIAGVISVQKTGEPGADGANFWIRGVSTFASGSAQNALILIDGTESSTYDLNALAPETIESFSVLKDATATALYGSRGANGVLLVTTKSGRMNQKPTINVRVEGRMSMPTQIPELADGVTYMKMFNEAIEARTPGANPQFTDDQIQGTIENRNPYLYPNNDWYDIIFKDVTFNQAANINVSGGSKNMDYFVSATFNNDMGLVQEAKENPLKNNIQNLRYSFQANVNTHISSTTKMGVKLNVQIQDYKGPYNSINTIFNRVMWAQPTYFPVKFPQIEGTNYIAWGNKSGGAQLNRYPNPYAELASGIKEMFRITTMATFNIDQDLKFITKGLSVKGLFSMKHFSSTTLNRTYTPYYFEIDPNTIVTDPITGSQSWKLRNVNNDGTDAFSFTKAYSGDRLFNFNVSLDYQRKFADLHDISAQLIYLQRGVYSSNPANYNSSLGELNQGMAGRFTYDFDKRYFFEFNFGYNGSDNFAKGKRFGFFPSYALGYIISNEDFFAPLNKTISLLKLRGSYGTVGNSNSSVRFPGYTNVNMNGAGYAFGEDFKATEAGAIITTYGNENATWEVAKKANVGIELGLFDQKFLLIADYFHENRDKILMTRQTISPTIGIGDANPVANVGKVTNRGVDMSLEYNHAFSKDIVLSVKGNFTYAVNKILEKDEPHYPFSYQYERGGALNRVGPAYIALGLFKDEEDIKNSPSQEAIMPNIKPGDIKYQDLNEDGVVNEYDRTYIGNPYIPQIVYGFGASFQYKNWDFSVFFQGAGKVSIYLDDIHPFDIYHKNVLKFVADDYWSASNPNPNAKYPRLAHNVDNTNTYQKSTFWLRDGSFLRLKNAEIGYSYKFMRAYIAGSNLLTFTGFKYWDPEIGGGSNSGNGLVYPLQRVFNLGVQFNF